MWAIQWTFAGQRAISLPIEREEVDLEGLIQQDATLCMETVLFDSLRMRMAFTPKID